MHGIIVDCFIARDISRTISKGLGIRWESQDIIWTNCLQMGQRKTTVYRTNLNFKFKFEIAYSFLTKIKDVMK